MAAQREEVIKQEGVGDSGFAPLSLCLLAFYPVSDSGLLLLRSIRIPATYWCPT